MSFFFKENGSFFEKLRTYTYRIISISAKVHANDERKDSRGDEGEKELLERGAGGKKAKRGRKRREKSGTEERRIARGLGGSEQRGQKTRENYGLPWSRPERHGAHCLAGYPQGNIERSSSLSLFLSFRPSIALALRPPLSHWDTGKVERTRLAALSLVSAPAAERPHRFTVGCSGTARLSPGAPLAYNDSGRTQEEG